MPWYQTKKHKANRNAIINEVLDCWGGEAYIRPKASPLPVRFVFDDIGVVWATIKKRENSSDTYYEYMIDKSKYDAASKKKRAIMLVQFDDGLFWCPFNAKHQVRKGGRKDRGDPRDIDVCVFYKMDLFEPVLTGEPLGKREVELF